MGKHVANLMSMESRLIVGIKNKKEDAFRELFHKFQGKIYRTAFRILKEEESAWDALQETFINIHRAANNFRGDSKLSTWINRITTNVCLEIIRKNKKYRQNTDEDISSNIHLIEPSGWTPYEELRRKEVKDRVQTALSVLNQRHRQVVRLHDLEGFTIREIAERLRIAEGTIKSRLFYGRHELRRQLIAA